MIVLASFRSPARRRFIATISTSLFVAWAGPAEATINLGDAADLAVTIWDPVGQASYTKDLGISILDFFNDAQSDNGYQRFWHINATDAAFAQLESIGTASALLFWQVTADDVDGNNTNPGELNVYTTLTQGNTAGVLNPTYAALVATTAATTQAALLEYGQFMVNVNNAPSAVYNTQGTSFAVNGSTFSRKGQSGYIDNDQSWQLAPGYLGSNPARGIINKVGNSSWFYKLSSASFDDSDPTAIDEFDNLGHDGYWGLAVDPATGDYVLSYTLQGATLASMAVTATGIARAGQTEYRASIGTPRLVNTPGIEFADYAGLSITAAVPEPATWVLSITGLAAVGWSARRRRG